MDRAAGFYPARCGFDSCRGRRISPAADDDDDDDDDHHHSSPSHPTARRRRASAPEGAHEGL